LETSVNRTWKDIAYDLSTDRYLGGTIKKDLPRIEEIKALVATETSNMAKLNIIYNFVRNNFTWNGYDSKYAIDVRINFIQKLTLVTARDYKDLQYFYKLMIDLLNQPITH